MNERKAGMKPCEDAGVASVEDGVVVLDGPDGVAVSMTPEAAMETAVSLIVAARSALDARGRAGADGARP